MTHDAQDVGWYVHFGRLSAATEGAAETAGSLHKKIGELAPGCVAAASDHGGTSFAAALASCHARFVDHFHGHATEVYGISDQLAQNHRHYSTAEVDSDGATNQVREV